jgi:hypothetical protein
LLAESRNLAWPQVLRMFNSEAVVTGTVLLGGLALSAVALDGGETRVVAGGREASGARESLWLRRIERGSQVRAVSPLSAAAGERSHDRGT